MPCASALHGGVSPELPTIRAMDSTTPQAGTVAAVVSSIRDVRDMPLNKISPDDAQRIERRLDNGAGPVVAAFNSAL